MTGLYTVEALLRQDGMVAILRSNASPRWETIHREKEAYGPQHNKKPNTITTTIFVTSLSAFWVEAESAWALAAW